MLTATQAQRRLDEYRAKIEPGVYRHYKGGVYVVFGVALHTETNEALVMYRAFDGTSDLYARPASMWYDEIKTNAGVVRRFEREAASGGTTDADRES